MRKQKTENAENAGLRYDAEMLSKFCLRVKAEGFVPAADLKTEFGPEAFTLAELDVRLGILEDAQAPE